MQNITRKKFINKVYKKLSGRHSYEAVYWIVKAVFECMTDVLEDGDKLFVTNCFTIQPRLKKERIVGNFGDPGIVPAHYVPYFNPMKRWKDICKNLKVAEEEKIGKNNKKHE